MQIRFCGTNYIHGNWQDIFIWIHDDAFLMRMHDCSEVPRIMSESKNSSCQPDRKYSIRIRCVWQKKQTLTYVHFAGNVQNRDQSVQHIRHTTICTMVIRHFWGIVYASHRIANHIRHYIKIYLINMLKLMCILIRAILSPLLYIIHTTVQ